MSRGLPSSSRNWQGEPARRIWRALKPTVDLNQTRDQSRNPMNAYGASQIEAEYYASFVFDRSAKAPLAMLSTRGGMDIEEVSEQTPEAIASLHIDPLIGFQPFHGRRLAFEAGVAAAGF